jgi:hypothetical protein
MIERILVEEKKIKDGNNMTFQLAKKILKMPVKALKAMAAKRGISVPGLIQDANKVIKDGLAKRPQGMSGAEKQQLTRAMASGRLKR